MILIFDFVIKTNISCKHKMNMPISEMYIPIGMYSARGVKDIL